MVQFKASTLLLAAVIVSFSTQESVLAKQLNGEVAEYQRSEYRDPVIRAIAKEVLYGRSELSSTYSSVSARGLELDPRNELGPIPKFFRDVGNVVKRMFQGYWRDLEDDVALFDPRTYLLRRQTRRAAVLPSSPSEESPLKESSSTGSLTTRHIETDEEAHALHSNKHRRRRFNYGRNDDGVERPNQKNTYRRRMDFDKMVRGYSVNSDDLEARNGNSYRRRMDFDQMTRGYNDDSSNLKARSGNPHRRRMDFDEMVSRSNDNSEDLEARSGNPHRRRMDFDQMVRGYSDGSDELEIRNDDSDMLPRMSWFGKAFLIYRDVNKARLEARSDDSIFDRDLVDGLHDDW